MNNRFGRFEIAKLYVDRFETVVKRVMGMCIITHVEFRLETDTLIYTAISEHFREVPSCERIPRYRFVVNNDGFIQFKEQVK